MDSATRDQENRMTASAPILNPTDVEHVNSAVASWAATGEVVRGVNIARVVVQDDALADLAQTAAEMNRGGAIGLIVDRTPMFRAGADLKALATDILTGAGAVNTVVLPEDAGQPFAATWESAQALSRRLAGYGVVVVVGSGSITDVVKYARHLDAEARGQPVPMISFPTAASVTAYTSALAVLKVDGAKRTLASQPPDAVICDLQTLRDAAPAMTVAGFGDVLARSVAYGDWYLAWQLGMDDGFSEIPGKLLAHAEQAMIDRAEAVAARKADGVRAVMDALLLAGMAMSVVNQTAPVSGWEHVISHFLDMTADHDGRTPALHGGQVGVGTLVSAHAYERVWATLDLDRLAAPVSARDIDADLQRIEGMFNTFDPSGKMAVEVVRDYAKKARRWQDALAVRRAFAERKRAGEYDAYLRANVRPARAVHKALARATAPRTFADLDQPIADERAVSAIRCGHLIRSRFTLGDLLDQSGWLDTANARGLLAAITQERGT
jgi:glycerol-1-phosphate dehydrogenase [NAD(P)+]